MIQGTFTFLFHHDPMCSCNSFNPRLLTVQCCPITYSDMLLWVRNETLNFQFEWHTIMNVHSTHCGLAMPCGDIDLGQEYLFTGNGLLPDCTKPLPAPVLTYHQRCSVTFTKDWCHKKCPWPYLIHNRSSEIALLKSLPHHLPRTNKLTYWGRDKFAPFCRQHFQMHFLEWKCMSFALNLPEVCSLGSNWQYSSIGSDNGLAPTRWQVIIWTNGGLVHWRIYASLSLNGLKGIICHKELQFETSMS